MTGRLIVLSAVLLALLPASCTRHTVKIEPIKTEHVVEVKPMEMTININVNVKVDKALDDFFGDLDTAQEKTEKK